MSMALTERAEFELMRRQLERAVERIEQLEAKEANRAKLGRPPKFKPADNAVTEGDDAAA